MSDRDTEDRLLAIAANGGSLSQQVEAVERELRLVHAKLDQILCSVESLARSPPQDGPVVPTLREAVEPAARAIHAGAEQLLERVRGSRLASGW
ncbi:MAG: hypothetical protein KUG77_25365 [Nannocystaceae bacterium]|nr:hypothetical protein [Nannocystaceae bacterium]